MSMRCNLNNRLQLAYCFYFRPICVFLVRVRLHKLEIYILVILLLQTSSYLVGIHIFKFKLNELFFTVKTSST